jgi:hypothetical protein
MQPASRRPLITTACFTIAFLAAAAATLHSAPTPRNAQVPAVRPAQSLVASPTDTSSLPADAALESRYANGLHTGP